MFRLKCLTKQEQMHQQMLILVQQFLPQYMREPFQFRNQHHQQLL
jgi:hypothetical protein